MMLRDGSRVDVRPIAATDKELIRQGFARLSPESRYRRFLSSGNSAYTIDLLKDAGVDMTTPAPVRKTLALFEQRLDEIERLLTGRKTKDEG